MMCGWVGCCARGAHTTRGAAQFAFVCGCCAPSVGGGLAGPWAGQPAGLGGYPRVPATRVWQCHGRGARWVSQHLMWSGGSCVVSESGRTRRSRASWANAPPRAAGGWARVESLSPQAARPGPHAQGVGVGKGKGGGGGEEQRIVAPHRGGGEEGGGFRVSVLHSHSSFFKGRGRNGRAVRKVSRWLFLPPSLLLLPSHPRGKAFRCPEGVGWCLLFGSVIEEKAWPPRRPYTTRFDSVPKQLGWARACHSLEGELTHPSQAGCSSRLVCAWCLDALSGWSVSARGRSRGRRQPEAVAVCVRGGGPREKEEG